MTYVTVEGMPTRLTISLILKKLSWVIRGNYQILRVRNNYETGKKTCYLKLSPSLDPEKVVNKINHATFGFYKVVATHSKELPIKVGNRKPKVLPEVLRHRMRIPLEQSPMEVLISILNELMTEMELKYTGLLNLSKKSNHQLMDSICSTIADRVKKVAGTIDILMSPNVLGEKYRKAHPHSADFQLILSTLHAIEDAQAQPRSQISEKELTVVKAPHNFVEKLPYKKPLQVCKKYSSNIIRKISMLDVDTYEQELHLMVTEHLKNLQKEPVNTEGSRDEEVARSKVREQLLNISPHFPMIINEVIEKHFMPKILHRLRMYGEPRLPTRGQLKSYFKELHAIRVRRVEKVFNLMCFSVPRAHYIQALATDGTVIGDCKLIIRSSDLPKYKIPESITKKMCALPTSRPKQKEVEPEENWEEW